MNSILGFSSIIFLIFNGYFSIGICESRYSEISPLIFEAISNAATVSGVDFSDGHAARSHALCQAAGGTATGDWPNHRPKKPAPKNAFLNALKMRNN